MEIQIHVYIYAKLDYCKSLKSFDSKMVNFFACVTKSN